MKTQQGAALLVVILLMQLSAWILIQGFSDTVSRHRQAVVDIQLAHANRAAESGLAFAAWKLSRGDPVPFSFPYHTDFDVTLTTREQNCGEQSDEELLCWEIRAIAESKQHQVRTERVRGFISEALCESGWWSL